MSMTDDASLPVVGISMGDYNGIGPELINALLADPITPKRCVPVVYGDGRILAHYRDLLEQTHDAPRPLPEKQKPHPDGGAYLVQCWEDEQTVQPGEVTKEAGRCAYEALRAATADLQSGRIDALVTAPINKANIQREDFAFPGHTEYLMSVAGADDALMLMVADALRVGVVTGHVPLRSVPGQITTERVRSKLKLLYQSLREDFSITKPKIALLGVNPHAGEEGLLGQEEQQVLRSIIEGERYAGRLVYGPYPADGFFGSGHHRKFDGVLAMYHDQGLVPFKTLSFGQGVNYTAGLPFVRTSPDHGTAYDLAGKGRADAGSMRAALRLATNVVRTHREDAS